MLLTQSVRDVFCRVISGEAPYEVYVDESTCAGSPLRTSVSNHGGEIPRRNTGNLGNLNGCL